MPEITRFQEGSDVDRLGWPLLDERGYVGLEVEVDADVEAESVNVRGNVAVE